MNPIKRNGSMVKTSRFNQRRGKHKTAVATRQLLPGNTDYGSDGISTNSPSELDTTEDKGLCERCRGLQIGTCLEKAGLVKRGHFATIERFSLNPHCHFCHQFCDMLDTLNGIERRSDGILRLDLSRQYLISLDEDEGGPHHYYLHARLRPDDGHVQGFTQDIFFFSDQGLLKDRRQLRWSQDFADRDSGDLHPIGKCLDQSSPSYDMIKQALRNCEENHLESCRPILTIRNILQLIDCETRQIVPATEGQRYICLSYVWGSANTEERTASLVLPCVIPKTVEDAMHVAIEIGIPFLWVDRYCIDQQNSIQKHNIIKNMDQIYRGADLTIIASVGDDPHHGLPGVRGTPRQSQYKLHGKACTYVAEESVTHEINTSKWSSRGWTYQETLLSRRRIVFTKTQIYYQCAMERELESLSPALTSVRFQSYYQVFPPGMVGNRWEDLYERLSEYYKRQLSFNTDIIDAFRGIINAFNATKFAKQPSPLMSVTHFYGVPVFSSDQGPEVPRMSLLKGLLWEVEQQGTPLPAKAHIFPSWTWASAKANCSPNAPGELYPATWLWTYYYDKNMYEGIEVRLSHLDHGAIDMENFPALVDDYTNFQPWLDVTTWTRPITITQLNLDPLLVPSYDDKIFALRDSGAVDEYELLAICLNGGLESSENIRASSQGLLVVQAANGTYRRIGTYYGSTDLKMAKFSNESRSMIEQGLTSCNTTGESDTEEWRQLAADGWLGPKILIGGGWQRRTMRLV